MADRYWVGGTASWDATAGTKWSDTDGGTGGASVPTAADNVFFTAASGTSTVTIVTATASCLNLNCTGFTGTLTGSTTALQVYGNFTLSTTMTFGFTFRLEFLATTTGKTITTAGRSIPARVYFGGVSGTATTGGWILQDAFTHTNVTVGFEHSAGTLDLNGVTVTTPDFNITTASVKTLYLRNSTINVSSASYPWDFLPVAVPNTTFDAGTSTINLTFVGALSTVEFGGGGKTYNNVTFTGGSVYYVTGTNTFNGTFTVAAYSTTYTQVQLVHKNTFNGTFATTGTQGYRPIVFTSDYEGQAVEQVFNCSYSLGHVGFRDIRALGSTQITATTIANLGGCSGINFTAPRNVYFVGTTGNVDRDVWSDSSGGGANTNFYPLPQDRAIINNSSPASITLVGLSTQLYIGGIDMSARTTAFTFNTQTMGIYGDIVVGSGVTLSLTSDILLAGPFDQTIYSNGKTWSSNFDITKRHEGGVYLGDAFVTTDTTDAIVVNAGKFDTNGYALTAGGITCTTTIDICEIYLRNSVCTFASAGPISFGTVSPRYNLTFDAGTSSIVCSGNVTDFDGAGSTFYDVSFTSTASSTFVRNITGANTYRNLSITGPATASIRFVSISDPQTITSTFSTTGTAGNRRVYFLSQSNSGSNTPGTTKTFIINGSTSLTDCDFEDIEVLGTSAPISGTRLGNLTRCSGITFDSPKTVYWNLAGTQNWSAVGWAANSGGTPDANNFPLAQDTAVFNESGSAGTISFELAWNTGSIDMSSRTTAMTLNVNTTIVANIRGNLTCGSGTTFTSTGTGSYTFVGDNTQTITCNGITLNAPISINKFNKTTVQLGSNLIVGSTRTLTLTRGTFTVGAYDVTTGLFAITDNTNTIVRMGSGTWYLEGTGTVWNIGTGSISNFRLYKETANIVLNNNTTTARAFNGGGGLTYNKVTIGGNTSTSTTTFGASCCFSELASTKTVAHQITFTAATIQRVNKWTISGTAGNIVTITSSSTTPWNLYVYGDRLSADYLSMSYTSVTATASAGEFYAGTNSTNGTGNVGSIFFTAPPAGRTLYWVGGTAAWDGTAGTKWALTSGGAGGEAVPTSADNVIFDDKSSVSNAAYTVTVTALVRCKDFTMSGPGGTNLVTWAGATTPILVVHGDFSLPGGLAGINRTYTGETWLCGSGAHTYNTNGVGTTGVLNIIAEDAEYTLTSAINIGTSSIFPIAGTLHTAGYTVSAGVLDMSFAGSYDFKRSLYCSNSVINLSTITTPLDLSSGILSQNMNFYANTSTINFTAAYAQPVYTDGQTFYNVRYSASTTNDASTIIYGQATYNDLTFDYTSASSVTKTIALDSNTTVNGVLTVYAPQNRSVAKSLVATPPLSNDFALAGTGQTRYITLNGTANVGYCTFRDIAIVGPGAGITGPGIGDGGGNQGITFPASKNVYWNLAGSQNFNANGWANTSGGTPNLDNFPLAHDTIVIDNSSAGTQITSNEVWHIGSINAASRSTAFTFNIGIDFNLYGDLNVGPGITMAGLYVFFRGRDKVQNITMNNTNSSLPLSILYAVTAGSNGTIQFTTNCSSTAEVRHYNGNINYGNNNVTLFTHADFTNIIPNTTKTINFGQAAIQTTDTTTAWGGGTSANTTYIVGDNSTLTVRGASLSGRAGLTFPAIISNTATLSISATGCTFKDLRVSPLISNGVIEFTTADAINYVENFTMRGNTVSFPIISAQRNRPLGSTEEVKLILKNRAYIETDYVIAENVNFYPLKKAWYLGKNSLIGPNTSIAFDGHATVGGAQFNNANEQTGFFTLF